MGGRCLKNRPHLEAEKAGKDGTLYVVCERCGKTLRLASEDMNTEQSTAPGGSGFSKGVRTP